ncbi:MAG: DNA repair protein RecO [Ruminococcus sp.]|nr:DNA repair protein RecO [Ruminococcus sp.]
MIISEGIVIRERPVGEQDKFIDILTKENGVVEASVRGARKTAGKSGSATQLFAYSRFCFDLRGDRLTYNSAEPIHIFYGLRSSLSKISLASYFAEVIGDCIHPEAQSADVLRLFLNCLHYLENGRRSETMLKAIFELRLMSEIGFMPDIIMCRGCGAFEPEELFFCIDGGGFYCSDCFEDEEADGWMKVEKPVLQAVRHIVLTDFDRTFNFRISDDTMSELSELTERYMLCRLERSYKTLDFYKSVAVREDNNGSKKIQ